MNEVIVLTRMYVGSYLQNNIGHEVINLFRDDNGDNYIYVNEDGRINPKYNDSVRAVLLVRYVEKGVMEIIAKAEELVQVRYNIGSVEKESAIQVAYVKENKITYGGVYPYQVHRDDKFEKNVITFKTNKLRKVKAPYYLIEDPDKTADYEHYFLLPEKHFSSQSLKMYYPKEDFPADYDVLLSVLDDESVWESENTTEKLDLYELDGMRQSSGFLSVIKKEYDELVYSNMFAYFFEQNRGVFLDFAKEVLGINHFTSQFEIVRESNNNIDLWIEDEKNVILIENKIKSKINGERHDIESDRIQSQLSKYYEYAVSKCPDKTVSCFLFTPDYNLIDLSKYEAGKYYKQIRYSQIYDFYMKNAGRMLHTNYFAEFVDALHIHAATVDNSNYEIMKSRFISQIKKILESRNV